MKRIRIVGLCVVAMFAIGAFAASSASALPEYGTCIPLAKTGKFKDSSCTEKATSGEKGIEAKYEFKKYVPNESGTELTEAEWKAGKGGFFSETGGHADLNTEHSNVIECQHNTASGRLKIKFSSTTHKQLPTKEAEGVVATFTECSLAAKTCENTPTATIVTKKLYGPIGYIKGKNVGELPKEIGQMLKPTVDSVGNKLKRFATFTCEETGTVEVGEGSNKGHNCIIGAFTASSIDKMSTSGELEFEGLTEGLLRQQTPTHFQGVATECNLETKLGLGGWEHSVQQGKSILTSENSIEIKAI